MLQVINVVLKNKVSSFHDDLDAKLLIVIVSVIVQIERYFQRVIIVKDVVVEEMVAIVVGLRS